MSRRSLPALIAPLALVAVTACTSPQIIESCEPIGSAIPLCDYQNPEDLALLPGGRHVVVSEYPPGGTGEGRLSLLELSTRERADFFEGGEPSGAGPWGAADCEGPPATIGPHGIHLSERSDGALQLLVVQHSERESVEMFEVMPRDGSWELAWRGCAEISPEHSLNDVVALPEGGFLVTRMVDADAGAFSMLGALLFGGETGWVFAWQPESGFTEMPGTRGSMPNGIELSPDGETVFLNQSLGNEVTRIDRTSGEVTGAAQVSTPDNSTWASDGRLWVASLEMSARGMMQCDGNTMGACPMPFSIVAIDPETLETEVLYEGGPGTPSGAGTVGLEIGGDLLIGTFSGDRLVWVER